MIHMANKVLLIGVDAATYDLIDPWVRDGLLPNLRNVMARGCRGTLKDSWLPITGPRWTTMLTGKNPGKHGVFDFGNMTPDYKTKPVSSRDVDAVPVQDLLSQAGKKVVLLNVPITYPVRPCNGCVVAGMPAPELNENAVYPPEYYAKLKERNYVILPEEVYQKDNEASMIREMHQMIDVQCATANELIRTEWDFFFFVFFATDMAGHWFWKHMDKHHPFHTARDDVFADTIKDVYVKMDRVVGELIGAAGPDTTVMLVSDHGMGPLHKDIFINNWLIREGFMHLKPGVRSRVKKALHDAGLTLENAYNLLQNLKMAKMTAGSSESADKMRRFLLDHLFISFRDVDWQKTVAFSATNFGPIFINLKGRQRHGIVTPGAEFERVRDQIIVRLKQFKDSDGKPVVEKVWKKEEIAHGPHLDEAPDVVFQITDMKYTSNRYFEFASNQLFGNPHRDMSGDHRNDGIILACGKHVRHAEAPVSAEMVDLVPTVLHLLDVPTPDDLDGKVLTALFDAKSEPMQRPPKTKKADVGARAKDDIRRAAAALAARMKKPAMP